MTLPARRICSAKKSSDSMRLPSAIWTGRHDRGAVRQTARQRRWFLRLARKVLRRAGHKLDAASKARSGSQVQAVHFAGVDGGDAGIFHRNEGEIGRGRRGKMQGRPRAQVVGDPLQPVKKIEVQQPHAANQHENENGQNDRRTFERFEFHRIGLNEKPEQLKAALAFKAL